MKVHTVESTSETVRTGFLDPTAPPVATIEPGDVVTYPDTWSHQTGPAYSSTPPKTVHVMVPKSVFPPNLLRALDREATDASTASNAL
jgi:hypothetical protein